MFEVSRVKLSAKNNKKRMVWSTLKLGRKQHFSGVFSLKKPIYGPKRPFLALTRSDKKFSKRHRKASFQYFLTSPSAFESWESLLQDPRKNKWQKIGRKFSDRFFWNLSLEIEIRPNFSNKCWKHKSEALLHLYIEGIALKTFLNMFLSWLQRNRVSPPPTKCALLTQNPS